MRYRLCRTWRMLAMMDVRISWCLMCGMRHVIGSMRSAQLLRDRRARHANGCSNRMQR